MEQIKWLSFCQSGVWSGSKSNQKSKQDSSFDIPPTSGTYGSIFKYKSFTFTTTGGAVLINSRVEVNLFTNSSPVLNSRSMAWRVSQSLRMISPKMENIKTRQTEFFTPMHLNIDFRGSTGTVTMPLTATLTAGTYTLDYAIAYFLDNKNAATFGVGSGITVDYDSVVFGSGIY